MAPTTTTKRRRFHSWPGLGLVLGLGIGWCCPVRDVCAAAEGARGVDPSRLPPAVGRVVDFEKEVRPLFQARCFECHGPEKQKAGLRLDRGGAALKGGESGPAIVRGKGGESPLIEWVAGLSEERVMPPKGERLTREEVGVLRAWIDAGAEWPASGEEEEPVQAHWAFRPVRRPEVPGGALGVASPIDAFVRERLARAGLKMSEEASRTTLIRRMYLVMLGVPPTPEEARRFVGDPGADAYERLVDRVLADGRYGERWARHWLDVVRFAESNGFETNRERLNAWRYRDYVIEAFNRDLPYDRFVREQLAGDAGGADVATGFLVGGPVDIVGSPDPTLTMQQRADELDDMVNTTGTAFLGLTLGCVRCHSHKFDPIEHREYYGLAAVFAGVKHGERPLGSGPDRQAELVAKDREIAELERRLLRFVPVAAAVDPTNGGVTTAGRPPVNARYNVEVIAPIEARRVRFTILAATSGEPCLDELEVYAGERNVALASAGARATASGTLAGFDIHQLAHVNDGQVGNRRSWISNEGGRGWVQIEFPEVQRIDRIVWGRDRTGEFGDRLATKYRIEVEPESGPWRVVAGSADRVAPGGKDGGGPGYRFEGLPGAEAAEGRGWLASLEGLRKERAALARAPMAYAGTFTQPGATHRLHRGDPMEKREPVAPGTLALFDPQAMSPDEPEQRRRLRLAEWITRPDHPLTARVLVNRLWQYQFGVGLVDTPNDFGRNGSPPTHPELLDWLASELVARGWSIKAVQREILRSATWRQASAPRPEALRVDAGSRLWWRFPPRRLEAEAVRDSMLAASGALDPAMGGPSFHLHEVDRENVYHYHPKDEFTPAEFRRMVYAFKVRMEHDAIFGTLDCPDGSLVMPRRGVSTTPLQALSLFNSRFVLQQAELLARRMEREGGDDEAARVRRAWQLAYDREPDATELAEARTFARAQGPVALARALLNSSEFLFIP